MRDRVTAGLMPYCGSCGQCADSTVAGRTCPPRLGPSLAVSSCLVTSLHCRMKDDERRCEFWPAHYYCAHALPSQAGMTKLPKATAMLLDII